MEVVVPQRVEAVAALLDRPDQPRLLQLVLGDDHNPPSAGAGTGAAADVRQDVIAGIVEDLLRRVEPQAVEMELFDPVTRV